MKKPKFDNEWFKLDNAAKIYPAAKNSRWNMVYRMAAVMKEKVDPDALHCALEDMINRFPSFKVTLKRGVFWYYLQYIDKKTEIEEETKDPCKMFDLNGKDYLFRVLYYRNRISLEIFHSITDGTGALEFLKTLVFRYIEIKSKRKAEICDNVMHYADNPVEEEVEDAFKRNTRASAGTLPKKERAAYHYKGQKYKDGSLGLIQGEMSADELRAAAKSFGCTINTYLTSVLEYVFLKRQEYENANGKKRPVKIQVPINLRKYFPTVTLRNFAGYTTTCIEPDTLDFQSVVVETARQLSENINREYCEKFINSNVSLEKNMFVRLAPLPLKSLFMNIGFFAMGENVTTSAFSNVGKLAVPESFNEYVERFEFVIGAQKYAMHSVSCISFNGRTVITFVRKMKDTTIEREFFRMLASHGINIDLISNEED